MIKTVIPRSFGEGALPTEFRLFYEGLELERKGKVRFSTMPPLRR